MYSKGTNVSHCSKKVKEDSKVTLRYMCCQNYDVKGVIKTLKGVIKILKFCLNGTSHVIKSMTTQEGLMTRLTQTTPSDNLCIQFEGSQLKEGVCEFFYTVFT